MEWFEDQAKVSLVELNALARQKQRLEVDLSSLKEKLLEVDTRTNTIRNKLRDSMETLEIRTILDGKIRLLDNPSSVKILNEDEIPRMYLDIQTVITVNKRAILVAAEQGKQIPGAEVGSHGKHIKVRM